MDKLTEILHKLAYWAIRSENPKADYYIKEARLAILSLINEKIEGMRKGLYSPYGNHHNEKNEGFNQALDQVKDMFKEER